MGDGGVETKKKEAGDAGGRQRPVTQRYTKKRRDAPAWIGVRHKVCEHEGAGRSK